MLIYKIKSAPLKEGEVIMLKGKYLKTRINFHGRARIIEGNGDVFKGVCQYNEKVKGVIIKRWGVLFKGVFDLFNEPWEHFEVYYNGDKSNRIYDKRGFNKFFAEYYADGTKHFGCRYRDDGDCVGVKEETDGTKYAG